MAGNAGKGELASNLAAQGRRRALHAEQKKAAPSEGGAADSNIADMASGQLFGASAGAAGAAAGVGFILLLLAMW